MSQCWLNLFSWTDTRSNYPFRLGHRYNTACVGLAGTDESSYSAGGWDKCIGFRTINKGGCII